MPRAEDGPRSGPSGPGRSRNGSRLFLAACFLGAFLAGEGPGLGQEPEVIHLPQQPVPAPPSAAPALRERRTPVNVPEVLGELWFRRKEYLEKGDAASAERQVQLMRDVVQREGILSAGEISGAFLGDGTRSLESGNVPRALQSFQLAKEFASDRPGPYFAVARTLWSYERDFGGGFSSLIAGVRATLENPSSRIPAVGNLLLSLVAGSLLASALWCLIAALRTFRLVQHDLYEGRKRSLSNDAARLMARVLWVLPALFWLTGPWILLYWLALAFIYMRGTERMLSLVACGCFVAALPVLGWVTRESSLTTDPAVRVLLESARGSGDPDRIPALEQMTTANPGQVLYRFLLAQSYHATGSTEAALQEYRQIQEEDRTNAAAWINSGNIFLEHGAYLQAADEYRRAINLAPNSALAHYNLYLALQGGLRLEEADAAFQKARDLDNGLITSILASGGEGNKAPVEARFTSEEILARLQRRGEQGGKAAWRNDWLLAPFPLAGALGFLGCLVLAWGAERWGLGRAQRCVKCGEAFCRRCQVGMRREEGYCTACRHLYVLKDPVAPPVREERERVVAAHARWLWVSRRLVSLVLPGAGQIQGGRNLLGAALLWMFCMAAVAMLFSGKMLASPGVAISGSILASRIIPAALMAVSWLVANTLAFEREGRG